MYLRLQVLVVVSLTFADQFGTLVIFPILPFMVSGFFHGLPVDQLGNYAGILVGACIRESPSLTNQPTN